MDKNRILLALKDDEDASEFGKYLSGAGFELTHVKDGAKALEHAIREVPALIFAALDLPVIGGERVFQILRANPHTSRIPFLFISDNIADIKGFRAGVDIFLMKPINMEEMYSRIRQTLSMKGGAGIANKDIEGKLTHMSLSDILQFLSLNKKEGELRVVSNDSSGTVFVKDGQVCNVVLGGMEKEKALFRLLQWNDGKFEFIPKIVTCTRKIRSSTGNLIMEGTRQIDELRKKAAQLPDHRAVIKAKADIEALPKNLQPIIYEILQLSRTRIKVSEVLERCSYPDYEVLCGISHMVNKGILEEERSKDGKKSQEFLTVDQAISIREKIISRSTDLHNLNCGKIMLLTTSGALAASFLNRCGHIPGIQILNRSALGAIAMENPLGESAVIRLHGGMDLVIFSIPSTKSMGPIWKAFSRNLIGLILLWDGKGDKEIKELAGAKKDILLRQRVPVAHVFSCGGTEGLDEFYRKALNLRADEPLFRLDRQDGSMVLDIFYSLFGNLLKDEYMAS